MPEGDTIFRAAQTLRRALGGKAVTGFAIARGRATGREPSALVAGRLVSAVEARGKHLLMVLRPAHGAADASPAPAPALGLDLIAPDLVLHTHMGMTGSWHIYRPGERWRKPDRLARVVVCVADFVAPCFSAPIVELLTARDAGRHPLLTSLGPDAIAGDFDPASARDRILQRGDAEVGVALADQRALAGVGNVYKSEVLFLARVSPFARVRDLPAESLDRLVAESRRLLRLNREGPARRTRSALDPAATRWVYGRAGRPCLACGEGIRMRRQGPSARSDLLLPPLPGHPRRPTMKGHLASAGSSRRGGRSTTPSRTPSPFRGDGFSEGRAPAERIGHAMQHPSPSPQRGEGPRTVHRSGGGQRGPGSQLP